MHTLAFGLPRLGEKRQYKTLLERFWQKKTSEADLLTGMETLEAERLNTYKTHVSIYPSGELSFYDPMLDVAVAVRLIPSRFQPYTGWESYFQMARGASALEMTKWFNTNYHYLVPEWEEVPLTAQPDFFLQAYALAQKLGHTSAWPSLIGPYTFLALSKKEGRPLSPDEIEKYAEKLLPAYRGLLEALQKAGAPAFLLHEPAFVLDEVPVPLVGYIYHHLAGLPIYLLTYYESVDFYPRLVELPVKGISLDFVSNTANRQALSQYGFPEDKVLIAGVIDGRNVWRANLKEKIREVESLSKIAREVWLAPSAPLSFLPLTKAPETHIPAAVWERLSFAKEKLAELRTLAAALQGDAQAQAEAAASEALWQGQPLGFHEPTRARVAALKENDFTRSVPYAERSRLQQEKLQLPPLPTTTIGSFPQTEDLRALRKAYREGKVPPEEYKAQIRQRIAEVIRFQEELALDVLVHGEFERSDMVEFFAERLEGFAITQQGWVLSYGSRVYRAPIIYGDVWRPQPMTVEEIRYAQSLTAKPVKGMLTGPVTILNWSYAPPNKSREEVAYQIALAILDEVQDLERAGIQIIQIDEPAFREGAPLKKRDWPEYFRWAVRAFRLASNAQPTTQIHSHMCYSEFESILPYIWEMDFDVVSIEASRSKGTLVEEFRRFPQWDRQIGLGVYDIHSPAIPTRETIAQVIEAARKVLPDKLLWVNPDCGLKTRRWEEVRPALIHMVEAAQAARTQVLS
ncbi:MAG: 5-methyltetrahydropteroyltriglutamate--homocysteine S-methyltransferase [Bacteroidia bacterium]|jgi:5-methyltetrahydropteroyltriglutamate--homocysteine methyltransferase|nr:5-methyltetrahydropteroyltriglutamate--homocysteine S-methyltransferase [Bacteroidia bacterium]GIV22562.1 MAG: 5-methyltetrahydropteroyltriglutamate--homocysteine methyltransferase [Bacteroidia bacterium]